MTRDLFRKYWRSAPFLLFGLAFAAAQSASAGFITWTVNNAVFTDTGTLTGTFSFDADTQTLGSYNLTTTVPGGGQPSGFNYTDSSGGTAFPINTHELDFLTPSGTNSAFLLLDFVSDLTDAGGDISLIPASSEEGSTFGSDGFSRIFTSGDASAVGIAPEPGTFALGAGCVIALLLFRRRSAQADR